VIPAKGFFAGLEPLPDPDAVPAPAPRTEFPAEVASEAGLPFDIPGAGSFLADASGAVLGATPFRAGAPVVFPIPILGEGVPALNPGSVSDRLRLGSGEMTNCPRASP
jgi:hypothetical protein